MSFEACMQMTQIHRSWEIIDGDADPAVRRAPGHHHRHTHAFTMRSVSRVDRMISTNICGIIIRA